MAKTDYISIAQELPPVGTTPKLLANGIRRSRVQYPSERWDRLVEKWGDALCWKAHWTEGGTKDD